MNLQHFDICILGAGLTGCLTALLTQQRGLKVCIIEKKNSNTTKDNFLPWETIRSDFFERLLNFQVDLTSFFENSNLVHKNEKMISAWGTSKTESYRNDDYLHIKKRCLLDELLAVVKNIGIIYYNYQQISQVKFISNKWLFSINNIGNITCNLVIDATGRNSLFAAKQGIRKIYFDAHYALFHSAALSTLKESSFIIESSKNGWWYLNTCRVSTQSVFISNLDEIRKTNLKQYFINNLNLTYFIKQGHKISSELSIRMKDARAGILSQTYGQNWIAIGDSAFTLDVLSGNGNMTIVETILSVIDLLGEFIQTKKNECLVEIDKNNNKIFFSHLIERKNYYLIEKRWPKSSFWSSIR